MAGPNALTHRAEQKVADLERELQEARARLEEAQKMPADRALAEELHEMLCYSNHDDRCDWFYHSWDGPSGIVGARKEYLEKATRGLEATGGDSVMVLKVAEAISD